MSRLLHKDGLERSLLLSLGGHLSVLVGGAIVSIVMARHYGRETFGQWAVALVFAQLTGTVVEGGLGRILMREAARTPERAGVSLSLALRGRVLLGVIAVPVALLSAWSFFGGASEAWVLTCLLVSGRFVEGLQTSYHSVLLALGRFRLPNLLQVSQRLARVVLIIGVVLLGARIEWAAVATAAVALATLVVSAALSSPIVRAEPGGRLATYWKDAFWFWIGGVLFWVNAEVDQLMLSRLEGDATTGIYAAAIRLIALCLVIPRLVADSVIPRLFRSAPASDGTANRDLNTTAFVLTTLGSVAAANLIHFAPELVEIVYTPEYAGSSPVLAVLGVFVLLHFARSAPNWFLSTSDRVRSTAFILALAAITNVAGNLILIPRNGALGAGIATVLSEGLLLLLALGWVSKITDRTVVLAILKGLAPGLAVAILPLLAGPFVSRYVLLAGSVVVSGALVLAVILALRRNAIRLARG